MTIHRIDFAIDLLGPLKRGLRRGRPLRPARPRPPTASTCPPSDVDDWSSLIGEFAAGATGVWEGTTLAKGYDRNGFGHEWAEINGSEGSAVYRLHEPNTILLGKTGHDLHPVRRAGGVPQARRQPPRPKPGRTGDRLPLRPGVGVRLGDRRGPRRRAELLRRAATPRSSPTRCCNRTPSAAGSIRRSLSDKDEGRTTKDELVREAMFVRPIIEHPFIAHRSFELRSFELHSVSTERVIQTSSAPLRRLTGVQVVATGGYVPEVVVRNEDLASLGCDPEWIIQRTGIRERRHAPPDMATSDMAIIAAERAIDAGGREAARYRPGRLATFTPDWPVPATACQVQTQLGINAPAMDIQAACAGFIYALITGMQFVATGCSRLALVIGVDTNSRVVDPNDKKIYPLFGDGAGAVLLAPARPSKALLAYTMGSEGSGSDLLYTPMGGSRMRPCPAGIAPAATLPEDGRPPGLQMGGAAALTNHARSARRGKARDRRRQPRRAASGERADHRRSGRGPAHFSRANADADRSLRQHLGRQHSARARRSQPHRPTPPRRPRLDQRLRRRPRLGHRHFAVVAPRFVS